MKFSNQNGTLQLITSRPVDGQIMDLAISDVNQDGQKELLVTMRTAKGILVDAQAPF